MCSGRVSHQVPRSVLKAGWTLGPGGGAIRLRAARRRRCASPAPACAAGAARALRSAPPPRANLVSGSRRRAPIGRPRAPRHNGAAPGRRARQRRGFPLSRSRQSAGARRSGRPGQPGCAGPRSSYAKVGGDGGDGGDGGGRGHATAGGGRQGRCGYLVAPHLGLPLRAGGTVTGCAAAARAPTPPGGGRARSPTGTSPVCWGHPRREEWAAAPGRCLCCPHG